jgi:hypothetical protein
LKSLIPSAAYVRAIISADQTRAQNEWHHSEQLRSLLPNSEYEIQVQARNAYGWGSFPRDYLVYETGGERLIAAPVITDHTAAVSENASPVRNDNGDASINGGKPDCSFAHSLIRSIRRRQGN